MKLRWLSRSVLFWITISSPCLYAKSIVSNSLIAWLFPWVSEA